MTEAARPREEESWYQSFSLRVGLRDWLVPNARHERLKLLVEDALEGRRGLRILDVGCGTGVMTSHLRRFGSVTGVDFSRPAVAVARSLVPGVRFESGDVRDLGLQGPFDLITLFDVLEHVPAGERAQFVGELRALLSERGLIIASTPQPVHTRFVRGESPERLQVVDEEVGLRDVADLAAELDLDVVGYHAYDVWERREYHAFVLEVHDAPPSPPRPAPRLTRRLRVRLHPVARVLRRVPPALRTARGGRPRQAAWILWPRGPEPGFPDEEERAFPS